MTPAALVAHAVLHEVALGTIDDRTLLQQRTQRTERWYDTQIALRAIAWHRGRPTLIGPLLGLLRAMSISQVLMKVYSHVTDDADFMLQEAMKATGGKPNKPR